THRTKPPTEQQDCSMKHQVRRPNDEPDRRNLHRAVVAQAYATLYNYWVGYSVPAQFGATAPATIIAPGGRRLASCSGENQPGLAIADIDLDTQDTDIDIALRLARPWRRTARAGLYDPSSTVGGHTGRVGGGSVQVRGLVPA
ncbi:hypothetical protein ACF09H_38685, partial [Streptomyces sp. NPDC014983]